MSQLLLRANTNLYPIWPLLNQRAKEERKVAKEQAQVYYWMSGSFSSLNYAPLDCSVRHRKVDSWFPFFSSTYNNFSWRLSWLDRAFLLFQLKTRAKNRNTFSLHFLGKKIFQCKKDNLVNQQYQKMFDFFLILKNEHWGENAAFRSQNWFCQRVDFIYCDRFTASWAELSSLTDYQDQLLPLCYSLVLFSNVKSNTDKPVKVFCLNKGRQN